MLKEIKVKNMVRNRPAKGPVARRSWKSLMADAHLHALHTQLGEIILFAEICIFAAILYFQQSWQRGEVKSKNENPILIHISRYWRNVECKNRGIFHRKFHSYIWQKVHSM